MALSNISRLLSKRSAYNNDVLNEIQKLSKVSYNLSLIENSSSNPSAANTQTTDIEGSTSVIGEILQQIEAEQECLGKLQERFSKRDITIAVIGRARQGKSTILQSLSGLDSNLIPGGSGLHCTASLSRITNSDQDQASATIHFYSRDDFFNTTILPYFHSLNLSPVPKTLAEFEVSPLPVFHQSTNPIIHARYQKLKEYHDNISKYNYLLTGISKQVEQDEIYEYVTQYSENRMATYKYLAVAEIEIACRFPYPNLGKLTLIDMPGVGDVGMINEEKKIRSLSNKVDFFLFVRKPDPLGDGWSAIDLDLYKLFTEANAQTGKPLLHIKDNSFLIFNHVNISPEVNNLENCKDMQAGLAGHGMEFSDVSIIDCSNKKDVTEKVLGNISSSFINKISQLDDKIMQRSKESILSISNHIQQLLISMEEQKLPEDHINLYEFKELFNNLWSVQTNSFENLLKQKYSLCNEPNTLVYNHFERTKDHIKSLLSKLTETDIKLSRNAVGSYNKAYEDFLNEYKSHITNEFLKLDDILFEVLKDIKNEVYEILKKEGRLIYMDNMPDSFDTVLIEEISGVSNLRNPVTSFVNFQLSYLGFLHFKIREYLNILTPDYLEIRLSRQDTDGDILNYIRHSVEACLYQIQKEFSIWSKDINKISFSLLEEFLNQIFRSNHAKDNWEIFYQLNSDKIWPEKYGKVADKQNEIRNLKLHLNNTKELTNSKNLATA
ncbi:hypothetical protein DYBT9275_02403 [Dyadobacter sp. CECT 9275]|uniref:Dynamin N-terminal domain-containing protein n=1 Tax=Dyadobacter helix TaxID=2822344 RepID=A0A916NC79_9BACT|nr:GTPase domain-containing protein [Dyadobacter sp. CECT 9275]CAG5000152.1 hypothetical protein DYBT9275_02403 [Dyadobacter sp. CECT 9275]